MLENKYTLTFLLLPCYHVETNKARTQHVFDLSRHCNPVYDSSSNLYRYQWVRAPAVK